MAIRGSVNPFVPQKPQLIPPQCTILSGGLAQIGWSELVCKFTHESGVGDVPGSFSYDGHRCKKWNVSAKDYGVEWAKGDVVTVTLDCDARTVVFYRNGVSLGPAYTDIPFGLEHAYFPAASIADGEAVRFNFGTTPLRYAVAGFETLVAMPKERHAACGKVLGAMAAILDLTDKGTVSVDDYVVGSATLWTALVALLDDYTVGSQLARFVRSLSSNQLRMLVESMMWSCEKAEVAWIVARLSTWLGFECVTHAYHAANPPLEVVCALFEASPALLNVFLEQPHLEQRLEDLFTTKSSTDADLCVLIPKMGAFWKKRSMLSADADAARADCEAVHQSLTTHEARLWRLFSILQGRDVFLDWLLRFARTRAAARSQSAQLSLFYLLLKGLNQRYDSMAGLAPHWVVSLPAERFDIPRLGGLLSYLQKEFPCSGADPSSWGVAEEAPVRHFHIMLEAMLSIYHGLMASRLKNLEALLKSFAKLDKDMQLQQQQQQQQGAAPNAARLTQLQQLCRVSCYSAMVLMSPAKEALLCKAVHFVCRAMNQLSVHAPNAFGYLPHYFLSFVLETMRTLVFTRLPRFVFVGGHEKTLQEFVSFLVDHMCDGRIANPEVRDSLLQSLCFYLSTKLFARVAEGNPLVRANLVPLLLREPSRNWVAVAMTLLRFWRGVGFGLEMEHLGQVAAPNVEAELRTFLETVAPPAKDGAFFLPLSPQGRAALSSWCKPNTARESAVFQAALQALCDAEPPVVMSEFLNLLFNTLNWCVSEFSVGMNEYKSASQDRRKDTSPIQKKCLVMFELGGSLMRLLEIVTMHGAKHLFGTQGQRVNMQRAMESCLSILERTILFPEKPRLDQLLKRNNLQDALHDRSVILPTFGALVNLWQADATLMVDTLVSQAALTPALRAFLQKVASDSRGKVAGEMLAAIESKVLQKQEEEKTGLNRVASVELCPICYGGAIDTRFLPCQHTSCADCIQRHLLNSKKCFFCNAEIQSTEPMK